MKLLILEKPTQPTSNKPAITNFNYHFTTPTPIQLLINPINNYKYFRNWEDMVSLHKYTFGPDKLNINPSDCKILLTEPPMNPLKNREKMVEVSHSGFCWYIY